MENHDKEDLIHNLNREEFRKRIGDHLPLVYFVLIGVVEGTAFHMFGEKALEGHWSDFSWILRFGIFLRLAVSGITIITSTYVLLVIVGLLRWNFRSWDVVIVFVSGLLQIAPLFFIEPGHEVCLWLYVGLNALFSALSFWFSKLACSQSMFARHRRLYSKTVNVFDQSFVSALLLAIPSLALSGAFYLRNIKIVEWSYLDKVEDVWIVLIIIGLLFFIRGYYHFYVSFYEAFGFRIIEPNIYPLRRKGHIVSSFKNGVSLFLQSVREFFKRK